MIISIEPLQENFFTFISYSQYKIVPESIKIVSKGQRTTFVKTEINRNLYGGRDMKKFIVTLLSLMFVISGIAFAKDYEVNKKAGDFDVVVSIDKNPPAMGKNNLTIAIKDAAGKSVTDATVRVDYSMPPMPGMPPMNYKADADLKDGKYTATMDLSMAGSWNITVKITRDGKTSKLKFSIDV